MEVVKRFGHVAAIWRNELGDLILFAGTGIPFQSAVNLAQKYGARLPLVGDVPEYMKQKI